MVFLKAALAQDEASSSRAAQEPVAWPIETNNQIEVLAKQCGWDNRRYMTPSDYQIWCDRMRQFVQLASAPAAQPAQQEDDADATIIQYHEATIKRLEKRIEELAQPAQQEPIGFVVMENPNNPQQRPWVGLTEDEIDDIYWQHQNRLEHQVPIWPYERDLEAKLKEKNT